MPVRKSLPSHFQKSVAFFGRGSSIFDRSNGK